MTRDELIQNPKNNRPQVVLLGAGASRAAFPNGDKNGKTLPLMSDLVAVLNLSDLLENHGIEPSLNFEEIYSNITDNVLREQLEKAVIRYFTSLYLPNNVTLYDRLLLSLREKDVIFTFNWDPLLAEAYIRNQRKGVPLPEIFFLHGNVALFSCPAHFEFNFLPGCCEKCGQPYKLVPLLYPIKAKDYFNSSNYIRVSWEQAQICFSDALLITILGYSAPESDIEAVELLRRAWFNRSPRKLEHVEIVDIDRRAKLVKSWGNFAPTGHYHIRKQIEDSWLWKWPRRTCEALLLAMGKGEPSEDISMDMTENLKNLQHYFKEISSYEQVS